VNYTSALANRQMQQGSFWHGRGQVALSSTINKPTKFIYLTVYRQNWGNALAKIRFKRGIMFRSGTAHGQDEDDCPVYGMPSLWDELAEMA
jgi:hypothetical protein